MGVPQNTSNNDIKNKLAVIKGYESAFDAATLIYSIYLT